MMAHAKARFKMTSSITCTTVRAPLLSACETETATLFLGILTSLRGVAFPFFGAKQ